MTDRELGRELAICCGINDPGVAWDIIAARARELLAMEQTGPVLIGVNPREDYAALRLTEAGHAVADPALVVQLDRIEKKLEDIESRLEMVPKVDREGYAGLHPNIAAGLVALGNRSLRNQP